MPTAPAAKKQRKPAQQRSRKGKSKQLEELRPDETPADNSDEERNAMLDEEEEIKIQMEASLGEHLPSQTHQQKY